MKFCYYVQICLVDNNVSVVNVLMSLMISFVSDDFVFFYGIECNNLFFCYFKYGVYEIGGGNYMFNWMMWEMFGDKEIEDLCLRYYFYCQDCDEVGEDLFMLDCFDFGFLLYYLGIYRGFFCIVFNDKFGDFDGEYGGYWGRIYGNEDGILFDGLKCIIWGFYLVGGKFDVDDCIGIGNVGVDGGLGVGIYLIMLFLFVDFLKVEVVLIMGVNGDVVMFLEDGICKFIVKMMSFSLKVLVDVVFVFLDMQIEVYVIEVLDVFNVVDVDGKLQFVVNEYCLVVYG